MRRLDHCVLPTASLTAARARLTALGFTVAPDAAHPFGTANSCVFFKDGTYLEPLSVVDKRLIEQAAQEENIFVLRDRIFRQRFGSEGFSALAFGTADAASDHIHFMKQNLSAGPVLSFTRSFADASGARSEASFRLAFASPNAAECFFFSCERVKVPAAVDRSSLENHANGVAGIACVMAAAQEPVAYRSFFESLCETDASLQGRERLDLKLTNARISLLSANGLRAHGIDVAASGLSLRAIVFRTASLAQLNHRLALAGVASSMHEGKVVVPPSAGQGATFIFEEFSA